MVHWLDSWPALRVMRKTIDAETYNTIRVALLRHRLPPVILEITFQFDPIRAVIPATPQAPVYLRRLKDKPTPLAERDYLIHSIRCACHSCLHLV